MSSTSISKSVMFYNLVVRSFFEKYDAYQFSVNIVYLLFWQKSNIMNEWMNEWMNECILFS